jgi:hypothetical protein
VRAPGSLPAAQDNLNRNVIRPVVRAANSARHERGLPPLPVAVTAHTFRRTYVTLMLEAGAPLTYVQDQVGHEDTKNTQEIYARVLRRQQRATVGAAFNESMYGARELAFRVEDETRSGGGDLLMRSPFEDAADRRGCLRILLQKCFCGRAPCGPGGLHRAGHSASAHRRGNPDPSTSIG